MNVLWVFKHSKRKSLLVPRNDQQDINTFFIHRMKQKMIHIKSGVYAVLFAKIWGNLNILISGTNYCIYFMIQFDNLLNLIKVNTDSSLSNIMKVWRCFKPIYIAYTMKNTVGWYKNNKDRIDVTNAFFPTHQIIKLTFPHVFPIRSENVIMCLQY